MDRMSEARIPASGVSLMHPSKTSFANEHEGMVVYFWDAEANVDMFQQ